MMTIFDVLSRQHREVEALFGEVQDAIHTDQLALARAAFQRLSNAVIAGIHAEHTMVYPQLARHAGLAAEIAEAVQDHEAIEQATNHVRVSTVTDDQWCGAVARLGKLLADHADYDEYILFPIARFMLTTTQIYGLAADYERAWSRSTPFAGVSITYEPEPVPPIYCHVRPHAA